MRFSLWIICDRSVAEIVRQKVKQLEDHLLIPSDGAFSPYWKDERCAVLEISANIERPDYRTIQEHIITISGADVLSVSSSQNDWECAHYASIDQLLAGNGLAFVVCNIFELQ